MTVLAPPPYTTDIHVIRTGIVRNLQKTTYYLRVPANPRFDRQSRTIAIPPNQDIELDYRDWKTIEGELIDRDWRKVLLIIRYPEYSVAGGTLIVINQYTDLPPAPPPAGTIVWAQYGGYQGIFYYDVVRGDWLSENVTTLTWNSATTSTAITVPLIAHADGTYRDNDDSGLKVPMTVVGLSGSQVNAALSTTRFRLDSTIVATGIRTEDIGGIDLLGSRGVQNLNENVRVDAGIILAGVRIGDGASIERPAMTAWLRERLTP